MGWCFKKHHFFAFKEPTRVDQGLFFWCYKCIYKCCVWARQLLLWMLGAWESERYTDFESSPQYHGAAWRISRLPGFVKGDRFPVEERNQDFVFFFLRPGDLDPSKSRLIVADRLDPRILTVQIRNIIVPGFEIHWTYRSIINIIVIGNCREQRIMKSVLIVGFLAKTGDKELASSRVALDPGSTMPMLRVSACSVIMDVSQLVDFHQLS